MSRVEILRGLVIEKMTVAVQEILAVVETTVAGYEDEVLLLKNELGQHKKQLDTILQPQVTLIRIGMGDELTNVHKEHGPSLKCGEEIGVDDVAQKESSEERPSVHEESQCTLATRPSDDPVSCPAHGEESSRDDTMNDVQNTKVKRRRQLPERYRSNHNVTDGENTENNKNKKLRPTNVKKKHWIELRIGLLKNCPETDLSNNAVTLKSPLQTIMCEQHLSESDFIDQLRSSFSELGENKTFEAYLADSTERSVPHLANRMTDSELYKTFRSCEQKHFEFYVHLKEGEDTCDTFVNNAATKFDDQPTASDLEHKTPSETAGINALIEDQDMACMDSAAQSEEDDNDWEPENNENVEENNEDEEHSGALRSKKIRKQREQKIYSGSCKVCGYLFRSHTILIKHVQSHLDHPECRCGVCGQQLESSEELKTHLEIHQKLLQCGTCGRHFVSIVSFQRHLATHKTENPKLQLPHNNDKPYKCNICSQSFKFKVQLQAHNKKHTGEKPYCCDVCGKSLTNFRNLCRHKLIHTGEKNYSCQQCGKLFYCVTALKQHEIIHTVREKSYLCDICSKAFYTKSELKVHQRIHDQSHLTKCTVCGKLMKGDLKKHMRTHTGEKKYICKECGKQYRCSNHLKHHMNKHLGVKPFTCTVCGYTCARKDHLDSHMRTHTGEKPYKCTLCDKAFTQIQWLKSHLKSHQTD